jgi:hypothetical protein
MNQKLLNLERDFSLENKLYIYYNDFFGTFSHHFFLFISSLFTQGPTGRLWWGRGAGGMWWGLFFCKYFPPQKGAFVQHSTTFCVEYTKREIPWSSTAAENTGTL